MSSSSPAISDVSGDVSGGSEQVNINGIRISLFSATAPRKKVDFDSLMSTKDLEHQRILAEFREKNQAEVMEQAKRKIEMKKRIAQQRRV